MVNRTFAKIAVGLLYKTVVLRTEQQSIHLARTLDQCGAYGLFVRGLRLECALTTQVCAVLDLIPNLDEFAFTFLVHPPSWNLGQDSALRRIRPKRVIVIDREGAGHQDTKFIRPEGLGRLVRNMVQSVHDCIVAHWNTLACVPLFCGANSAG